MKPRKKPLFAVLMVALVFLILPLAGCGGQTTTTSSADESTFTVTFETHGGSSVDPQEIRNGRRVTEPADPVLEGSLFAGWFADDGTFLDAWDFGVDIVTSDLTLYANWITVQPYPTDVAMEDVPFASSLVWIQSGVTESTEYALTFYAGTPATRTEIQKDQDGADVTVIVKYFEYSETGTLVPGTFVAGADSSVTWTPSEEIAGGAYRIRIETDGANPVSFDDLLFKGTGSEANPYLLFASEDVLAMASGAVSTAGMRFLLADDVAHEVAYAEIQDVVFEGILDGNGKNLTLTGNAGLFYGIGEDAEVFGLTLLGTISTASTPTLGGLACLNDGSIHDVVSRLAITSSAGTVGDPDSMLEGGAGGLVGINGETGTISACTFQGSSSADGVIKASIGGGGIASINYGTITGCENRGCLGGYNSVESGKSMSNYSYMGGIAGFNFGTIFQSRTTSSGKLLAQRYYNNGTPTDTANNRVIGGIVGYNAASGSVTECEFSGIRVHGDQYVGGIAGINAGTVDSCCVRGEYFSTMGLRAYVGGRLDVGGIAGALEGSGTVSRCYVAANVYSYDEPAWAIAETATDCVYLSTNLDPRATGDQTYGNVPTDVPTAPQGTGNVAVDNGTYVKGDGLDYQLSSSYLSVLGSAFADASGEARLPWTVQ